MFVFRPAFRYPAPGNRNRDTGTLYNVGLNGYSWSSLSVPAGGSYAYFLHFYYDELIPQNGGSRAYGFQVRCLLE